MTTSMTERLAAERRARLAAERMLDLRSRELFNANKKLSSHALQLSGQIVEQRHKAEVLKEDNQAAKQQLQQAEEKVEIVERRLWDSVETITDGFAVFNDQDRLIAANSAWLALFAPDGQLGAGSHLIELFRNAARLGHIDLGEATPDDWAQEIAQRWLAWQIPEYTLSLVDGRYFRLIDRRSRDGDMVCLAQDITAIKQREAQLNEARKNAEAAARAKSAFLANMSHELRTPMNGVVSMAELLLEMDLDDEQEIYANTIRSSGTALLHIINDVLDFSKLEAERMVLHPEPFDLERLINEVLVLVAPTARDKDLALLLDYDLFLPTRMVGDPGRIRQILTNLVGNAVKFTREGHVLVRAVGFETEDNKWQLHVTVEDTGIGIPKDKQGHIFGSFSQVDDAQTREFEGTGLGLSISEQLVTLMGGEIWVESEPGEGTCFGFRVELPSDEKRRAISEPIEHGLAHGLVIGGSNIERKVLKGQLEQLGVATRTFARGDAGLEALRQGPNPQMIFIEDELEDGSGFEIVKQIRASGCRSAIILVTLRHRLNGWAEVGANAYISRPMLRGDLFQTLASLSMPDPGPTATDATEAQPDSLDPAAANEQGYASQTEPGSDLVSPEAQHVATGASIVAKSTEVSQSSALERHVAEEAALPGPEEEDALPVDDAAERVAPEAAPAHPPDDMVANAPADPVPGQDQTHSEHVPLGSPSFTDPGPVPPPSLGTAPAAAPAGIPPAGLAPRPGAASPTQSAAPSVASSGPQVQSQPQDVPIAPLVRAPAAAPIPGAPEASTQPLQEGPSPEPAARKLKVLAADDNKTNRFVFSKMVKSLDIELDFATDGVEAVEKYEAMAPDMIFMDISMPRLDGRQATAEIRKREGDGPRVPIIALTALAVSGDEADILSHGLDRYLSKPIKKQALLDLVAEFCPPDCLDPFPKEASG